MTKFNFGTDYNRIGGGSDFFKVRVDTPPETKEQLAYAEKLEAQSHAQREVQERERKVRYVSGLVKDAKLLYRAAEIVHVELPELHIEACIKLVTTAAITDSLQSIDITLSATGG